MTDTDAFSYVATRASYWEQEELNFIAAFFRGGYTLEWDHLDMHTIFLTIKENKGLYDSTKLKCLLHFFTTMKANGYTVGLDFSFGKVVEEIVCATTRNLHDEVDWKKVLTQAAAEHKLPECITFYIT